MTLTVCITGTTRGIGLEFAKQYAQAGWQVLACARQPQTPALQRLKEEYPNVSLWELDVCNERHLEKLTNDLQGNPIDLLINSAGIYGKEITDEDGQQRLETVTSETMEAVFRTNAIAPLMVSRALLDNVLGSRLKTIVTLTSRAGSIGDNLSGGMYAYRASKAAANMVKKGLAVDLQPKGVRVLVLHPGWVQTDMGGADALIDVITSVAGMRQVIEGATNSTTIDTDNLFFNYKGETLPW